MGILDANSPFGSSMDDPRTLAMLALAGGMIKGDFGGGLLAYGQAYNGAQDAGMKRKLTQAQLENYNSEVRVRDQKLKDDQEFSAWMAARGGGSGAPAAPVAGASNFGIGLPEGGGLLRPQSQAPAQSSQPSWLMNLSPEEQFFMKLRGKDPVDIIKENKPKWENVNGNLVNTNAPGFAGGFQPGMSVSSSGQAMMWQPDGSGGLVFGAPKGALDAYGAYQDRGEASKAKYDLTNYTPQGSNPRMTTRAALVADPAIGGPGVNSQSGNTPAAEAERTRILQTELQAATQRAQQLQSDPRATPDLLRRAQSDVSDLNRQLGRQGGAAGGGIVLQSPAENARAEALARGEADRSNESSAKGIQFNDFRDQARIARSLLSLDPTHSVPGAGIDAVSNFFGHATQGGKVANQLDLIGSWMTQNVPKAPGAQSNYELTQYQQAAGQVGNRSAPIENRVAALDTLENLISTWEKRRATGAPAPNEPAGTRFANGKVSEAQPLPAAPSPKNLERGKPYTLPDGRVGVWDGMGFKVQ
jgi:hypothetical protein